MVISRSHPPSRPGAGDREERARAIRTMFSAIAPRYDLLNHLLSLNVDRIWRRRAVRALDWDARPAGRYLDACSGTFDLAIELAGQPEFRGVVIGSDFAHPMLKRGRPKIERRPVLPACADTLRLPFPSDTFDGAMVAFGVRNLTDAEAGLRELHRVLRSGGRLVVLDFATPARQPLRGMYLFYFTRVLPFIGKLISKHSHAYRYLPESVLRFATPPELAGRLEDAGFTCVEWRTLTGGIACLWCGVRAAPGGERQVAEPGDRETRFDPEP